MVTKEDQKLKYKVENWIEDKTNMIRCIPSKIAVRHALDFQ